MRTCLKAVGMLLLSTAIIGVAAGQEAPVAKHRPLFDISSKRQIPEAHRVFDEVRELLLEKYYSTNLTEGVLYQAAINGMLRHVSPPQDRNLARMWLPDEYQRIVDTLKGVRLSIGIKSSFSKSDGSLTVTNVTPGSPADGVLQPLDRIMRINGVSLKEKQPNTIERLLEGTSGEKLTLKIVRDIEVLDVEIAHRRYKVANLISSVLPNETAHIVIRKITKDISADLKQTLEEYRSTGIHQAIIDLRGNSGGVFIEGLRLAELFLPAKSVLLRTLRRPNNIQNYVSSNPAPLKMDIVLLVDKKTASSSEIFAAAMQSHKAAPLLGTSTYGKATMEETFTLSNNYRLKFIVGALYTPLGASWQGKGLTPDFYVDQNPDSLAELTDLSPEQRMQKDRQLAIGWKLLQREVDSR